VPAPVRCELSPPRRGGCRWEGWVGCADYTRETADFVRPSEEALWSTTTQLREAPSSNAAQPSRRVRFSLESRCRIVQPVLADASPPGGAACSASRATGYRLRRRYQEGGLPAPADRPSTPKRQSLGGCRLRLSRRSSPGGSIYARDRRCSPLSRPGLATKQPLGGAQKMWREVDRRRKPATDNY
jgi:hypothetical protein